MRMTSSRNGAKISIIVPVLNEQDSIQALVERISHTAYLHGFVYEIIVVDDYSTDNTAPIIKKLSNTYPLSYHLKKGKSGKAYSLLEGFSYAQYPLVCMIDADLQYPPEAIPSMIEKIENNQADIIVGNRKDNRESLTRKLFSKTYRYVFGKLLHQLDCDVQSGLKVFRKEILKGISLDPSPWAFDLEFLVAAQEAGYTIASKDITFYERVTGKTKVGLVSASLQIGLSALKLKLRKKEASYQQIIFTAIAIILVACFAGWWFNPAHIPDNYEGLARVLDYFLFAMVSYIIWHQIIMEVLTWCIASHIKTPQEQKPMDGLKVAFVTTIVPSNEPLELLHKCLPAMVRADYPHDTWVLDEGNSPEVKAICRQYGVKHFSRFGKDHYNESEGKFAKKTKGGNHNAWYDTYGNTYDIVAQLDTDFVPKRNFLTKTLGYFRDPKVAFVGTPQIYGNTKDSLIARGAAEQLYTFYGPVLRGLSGMHTTLLIGANHVVRVAALKDVDHYSAHITEDLLTGMKLHKNSWKSIYVPLPLAIGEAPVTWEAYFNQQMRWAYGCIDILFRHSPTLFKEMDFRRAIYYFFLQQHYFTGIAMGLSIYLLSCYFLVGIMAANVNILTFGIFYSLVLVVCWLMSVFMQRYHVRPEKESGLLLAGKFISIASWPIYCIAFISVLLRKRLTYKVTPKGENDVVTTTPLSVFMQHLLFGFAAIFGILSSFVTHRQSVVMLYWACSSAILMLIIPFSQQLSRRFAKTYTQFGTITDRLSGQTDTLEVSVQTPFHSSDNQHVSSSATPTPFTRRSLGEGWPIAPLKDMLFLAGVTIASVILYVSKLGFYSDDWQFIGSFTLAHDHSFFGLLRTATTSNTMMRPVQNIYDVVLYMVFGLQPIGYQIVNASVLLGTILLLYLVLRKISVPRIIAVTIPLIYMLLPNYSADRFWYAAFQANLSICFYLLSLYVGLLSFSSQTIRANWLKLTSLISMVISILAYEVVTPLYLVNMVLFAYQARKSTGKKNSSSVFNVLTIVTLIYLLVFKYQTTTRLANSVFGKFPQYLIYLIGSAIKVNYITLGLQLPYIWWQIFTRYGNITIITASLIVGMITFAYLTSIAFASSLALPNKYWMRNLTCISVIIFLLGYAIFFTNNNAGFSPTGITNRITIAAALGVACTIVGSIGWITKLFFPNKVGKVFFCLLITIMSSGGFLVINTLASFWAQAYQQDTRIIASIKKRLPTLPKNTTIILDGICPYVGPAPVFESQWDLKGALQTTYHDASLQADVVTPRLSVQQTALHTRIYSFDTWYPYNKHLMIYNYKNNKVYPIQTLQAAQTYFNKIHPDYANDCPQADAGDGVEVFNTCKDTCYQ